MARGCQAFGNGVCATGNFIIGGVAENAELTDGELMDSDECDEEQIELLILKVM